jgi:hypothetical protein
MQHYIPTPFIFNPYKHHAGFLRELISEARDSGFIRKQVLDFIKKIGNSMIDIYHGVLSADVVIAEIRNQLAGDQHFEREQFEHYINQTQAAYVNIRISDSSIWTLLKGNDQERHIHIHPARHSPHTFRARALALKTALILKIYYPSMIESGDLVILVNEIRKKFLEAPPIKNMTYTKNLLRVINLI